MVVLRRRARGNRVLVKCDRGQNHIAVSRNWKVGVEEMGNGKWEMDSGQWAVGSGKWEVRSQFRCAAPSNTAIQLSSSRKEKLGYLVLIRGNFT